MVTKEYFEKLEKLCCLQCTSEETVVISKNLNSMLSHAQKIEELKGEDVEDELTLTSSATHEDGAQSQLTISDIEKNAPSFQDGLITTFPLTYF